MNPDVSIIITTFNRVEHLKSTLDALGQLDVPKGMSVEIVIVDNASTDQTREVIQSAVLPNKIPVRYVLEAKPGKSNALNTALSVTAGEILLLTDDDVVPPRDWIEGMCRPIILKKADAVAGGVRIAPHLERPWMTEKHRATLADTCLLSSSSPAMMVGANMAFSTRVLEGVPSFDPELGPGALGFHDENIFSQTMLRLGYRLVARFDIVVEHHFEEARLLRRGWLKDAKSRGMSDAYVLHHINHGKISLPYLRLLLKIVKLAALRASMGHQSLDEEGVDLREAAMVQHIHYIRHYLSERKRPHNYEFGTLRRIAEMEQPAFDYGETPPQ